MAALHTIVIAWVEMTGTREAGSHAGRYGRQRTMEAAPEARAATWVLEGTAADVEKAKRHAASAHADASLVRVYTFATDDDAALAKARDAVLREFTKPPAKGKKLVLGRLV